MTDPSVLVTGGAGFIGCNLADRLAASGRRVRILDDQSRPGVGRNVRWLLDRHGSRVEVRRGDVRDAAAVSDAVAGVEAVFHLAAQVAVTTSLDDPRGDFEINAGGTLRVLDAVRRQPVPPLVVFTSTNKVYGEMDDVEVGLVGGRYAPADAALATHGVPETRPLHFHSPYGCSKGAADQYVLDHGRSYHIPTCVLRMSCIYGPRQFGTEDQGWVAHFLRRARQQAPITIYGDGRQVRDVLFVDDLIDAMTLALDAPHTVAGRAFNLGGGPGSTLSLLELLDAIERLHGRRPDVRTDAWRRADQRWYVSDPRAFAAATGWRARVGVAEGLRRLDAWIAELSASEHGTGPRPSPAPVAVEAS